MNSTQDTDSYPFTKMEGLGNDFIVMDDRVLRIDFSAGEVRRLCDRHFGIGADGLILLRPATDLAADFSWGFYNADGSVAEMCGNGIRCIGAYLSERGLIEADQDRLAIQTGAGVVSIRLLRDSAGRFQAAKVAMGQAVVVSESLSIAETEFFCVSMGNPHVVTFVADTENAPVTTLGPLVEVDAAFPDKTNVEFAAVQDRSTLRLRVWERGVGETLACGTGACAAAVAACLKGLCDAELTVILPGGALQIEVDPATLQVIMTGPARTVFEGTICL
ncbi:MAG: diaminopimelate epimerase [Actinomycetia bacterium]|nr:diaminopimelate epimerase [Actinomycetes bacterium]